MIPKILLVEDNNDFRKLVRFYLEKEDMDMKIFDTDSGERGIAMAKLEYPDIVIMDIRLPAMSGIAAAEQIKQNDPNCDIIILTMFETYEFKKAYRKGNIAAFIGKSDLYDLLMPTLRKCMEERKLHHSG